MTSFSGAPTQLNLLSEGHEKQEYIFVNGRNMNVFPLLVPPTIIRFFFFDLPNSRVSLIFWVNQPTLTWLFCRTSRAASNHSPRQERPWRGSWVCSPSKASLNISSLGFFDRIICGPASTSRHALLIASILAFRVLFIIHRLRSSFPSSLSFLA